MARPKSAPTKPSPHKQPLVIRTHTLSQDTDHFLRRLSQEASDALGWTVSSSAVIRALIRYAARQPPAWASAKLIPLIEEAIAAGTVWGSKKK